MADEAASGLAAGRQKPLATWRRAFLDKLAQTSNVPAAARVAGVTESEAYAARRRSQRFASEWQDALAEGYEHLEMALLYRLRTGELKQTSGSKRRIRTYDLATGIRMLSLFRERSEMGQPEHSNEDTEAVIASINEKLEKRRRRLLKEEQRRLERGGGEGQPA